jgi:hypothetical protein
MPGFAPDTGPRYRGRTMRVPLNIIRVAVPALVLATVAWLVVLWQPARQVRLHTETLLERVSARDWPAVEAMMAPDYSDAWGHDRAALVDDARTILSHFFALHVVALEPPAVTLGDETAEASARLGVFGSGTGVAQAVIEEVQALREPFILGWRKVGPWPWDWELVSLAQREIEARFPGGWNP